MCKSHPGECEQPEQGVTAHKAECTGWVPAQTPSSGSGHHSHSRSLVSTQPKDTSSLSTKKDGVAQRVVQVSDCRKCQSLTLLLEGSREKSCMRCDHVDNLLSLVAELEEEGERLRSVGDSEKELSW